MSDNKQQLTQKRTYKPRGGPVGQRCISIRVRCILFDKRGERKGDVLVHNIVLCPFVSEEEVTYVVDNLLECNKHVLRGFRIPEWCKELKVIVSSRDPDLQRWLGHQLPVDSKNISATLDLSGDGVAKDSGSAASGASGAPDTLKRLFPLVDFRLQRRKQTPGWSLSLHRVLCSS